MLRRLWLSLIIIAVIAAGVWAHNSSWLHGPGGQPMTLLAHRGVHQTYHREGLTAETCTAERIDAPAHEFLENTLASMAEAFRLGADVVEFDIHPTTDGHFAVFHDWTVDCRTDGKGVTREHSLAGLKALDIGYGYTADGGRTYPFRGKGIGGMPSLDEVLERFPDKRFLINIKSNDPAEGDLLAARLEQLDAEHQARLMVYGGGEPVARLKQKLPNMTVMSKASLKRCILSYAATGWIGHVPQSCRNTLVLLPVNVASWIWGYPHRLTDRMRKAGTEIFLVGPYAGGEFARGVDSPEMFRALPNSFGGGIWTNKIELIAPLARGRSD